MTAEYKPDPLDAVRTGEREEESYDIASRLRVDGDDEAADEIERLRADSARLDYIEQHARCDPKMDGQHVWWPTTFNSALTGPNLRAAIDAKLRKE